VGDANIDQMLLNTHFVEVEGKIYRKRKAYIKWYYFDHNDYPAEWRLRPSKSPVKKVKQMLQLECSPDSKKESPDNSPDGKSRTGSPF
jgi:hypothetical protein